MNWYDSLIDANIPTTGVKILNCSSLVTAIDVLGGQSIKNVFSSVTTVGMQQEVDFLFFQISDVRPVITLKIGSIELKVELIVL